MNEQQSSQWFPANRFNEITLALVCYQEKNQLADILNDIKQQTAFHQIKEVLLFQNGSCHLTRQVAESFLQVLPLRIFSSSENHLGRARAFLSREARSELIAWTDSDCRLPKTWLSDLLSRFKSLKGEKVVAVGGPNRLPEDSLWQKALNLSLSHPLGHGYSPQAWQVSQKTRVSHIPTTNGLFLKKAVLQAGNFSEKFWFSGEDLDLGLRMNQLGDLFLFPTPLVINHYASSYFESLKRLFIFGKSRGRSKDWILYVCLLFLPIMAFCLALGLTLQAYFLLVPAGYALLLLTSSLWIFFQKKGQWLSFVLPCFWSLQHVFYSAGVLFGQVENFFSSKELGRRQ